MPMLSSVSTEIDSLAPWSASRRHSSSVRVLQCTWTWSGPSRPAAANSRTPLGSDHTQPVCVTISASRSRAAAISARVVSNGSVPYSVSATPRVSSASRLGKWVSATRRKSASREAWSVKCGGWSGFDSKKP